MSGLTWDETAKLSSANVDRLNFMIHVKLTMR